MKKLLTLALALAALAVFTGLSVGQDKQKVLTGKVTQVNKENKPSPSRSPSPPRRFLSPRKRTELPSPTPPTPPAGHRRRRRLEGQKATRQSVWRQGSLG